MRGSSPGERRGGRRKGTPNKKTAEHIQKVAASGLTPLDYLLSVMRDTSEALEARLEAAKAAAPYVHPRLSTIAMSGKMTLSHEERLARLK